MQEPAEFVDCAERLKAIADPTRLQLVQILFEKPETVGRLAEIVAKPIIKVSHDLAILRHAKIVCTKRLGRFVQYSLHPDVRLESRPDNTSEVHFGCCRLEL